MEQTFRLINDLTINWSPGHVEKRPRERGVRDHRLDAKLTLEQFEKKMIYTILRYNVRHMADYPLDAFMIRDEVGRRPVDLWKWGILNRSGHLRERTDREVVLGLLPRGMAAVTHRGIRFENIYYTCERAISEQWFEKARAGGSRSISICYDHRRVDTIYLLLDDGRKVEPLRLLRDVELYGGRRLEEVLHLNAIRKVEDDLSVSEQLQEDARLEAQSKAIDKEATEKVKAAGDGGTSSRAKLKTIKGNRARQKAENRKMEAFDLTGPLGRPNCSVGSAAARAIAPRSPKPPEEALFAGTSRRTQDLEILRTRRKREEADED